jgi:hypothetical protein
MQERRQSRRAPLVTQIEAHDGATALLGQVRNLSAGGLLVDTSENLPVGIIAIVRFSLPSQQRPIQAAARVLRSEPGKSMGLAFLRLQERDQQQILAYAGSAPPQVASAPIAEGASPPLPSSTASVPRRMPLWLNWQDHEGRWHQEAVETQQLRKCGAVVHSFVELEPGQLLWIKAPSTGNRALAHVASVAASQVASRLEVTLEILSTDEFWGIEFPPHRPAKPKASPTLLSSGGQVPRRVAVVLIWTDEWGRVREEEGETRLLSRQGAVVSTSELIPSGQPLRLRAPEVGREAYVQIVGAKAGEIPGRTNLEVEFVEGNDFWGALLPSGPGPTTV